jgi:hypothetical protein
MAVDDTSTTEGSPAIPGSESPGWRISLDAASTVDHGVALIIVVLIAVVGALAYGLVRLVRKRRARAPGRQRDAEKNRGLGA